MPLRFVPVNLPKDQDLYSKQSVRDVHFIAIYDYLLKKQDVLPQFILITKIDNIRCVYVCVRVCVRVCV